MTEQPSQPQNPSQPQAPNTPPPPPGYGYPGPGPAAGAGAPGGQPGFGAPQPGPGAYGQPGPGGYPTAPPVAYVPPGTYTGDPNAPYGYDVHGRPFSSKSKIVAGVLQLTLGSFGVGRFYMGNVGMGVAQLLTCGGLGIWALVDGILILAGSNSTDSEGRPLRG
ncbi:TM2 domain-containing protein [Streptomyces sp. NPDC048057]|uniref:TM2 domain-containing protein n=1 Tax=Streptomyces sp. NPDC048057 TaxID=3155628 RepID=UPI0033D9CA99